MLDLTKTYTTRDGRTVHNLRHRTAAELVPSPAKYPYRAEVGEGSYTFSADGKFVDGAAYDDDLDLVIVGPSEPVAENVVVDAQFDPTKPAQLRKGVGATIVATGVLEAISSVNASRLEGQTILARHADDEALHYHFPGGGFMSEDGADGDDLINVPEGPKVSEAFHTFKMRHPQGIVDPAIFLGTIAADTYASAAHMHATSISWDGVVKVTTIDGKLKSIEVVTA